MLIAGFAHDWFGTIPGWLTLLAIVFGAYFLRGKAGGESLHILREQRDILADRVKELESANADLTKRVADLEARKDVALAIAPALKPVTDWAIEHEQADERRHGETALAFQSIAEELKAFDTRSEKRAEHIAEVSTESATKLLAVLNMIADRLGPEPN